MLQLETVPLLGLVLQKAKNCNSCVFDVKCALFHCYISFSVCFLCWIEDILFFEEWICFLFFFHLLSSIAMRDIVTLQVHIFVVFFFHGYLTPIKLTKYKCALFVYWKIMFSNVFKCDRLYFHKPFFKRDFHSFHCIHTLVALNRNR